jgi:hypothetical protein
MIVFGFSDTHGQMNDDCRPTSLLLVSRAGACAQQRREYGHTFDSQIFGALYLPAIGLPSLFSAAGAKQVIGEPDGVSTHDFRWYEMSANRHAARYFSRHYGIDWSTEPWRGWTYETLYPRRRR